MPEWQNLDGIYNLASQNVSINEIAETIKKEIPECQISYQEMKFEDLRDYHVSINKLKLEIGSDIDPKSRSQNSRQHSEDEKNRSITELQRIDKALANRVGHMTSNQNGSCNIANSCNKHGFFDGQCFRGHRSGHRVSHVIGSDIDRTVKCH